jgi:hypothetical protein
VSAFEDLRETMDAQVDRHLGDSITYHSAGVLVHDDLGNPTIPGFLVDLNDEGGFDGVQPLHCRWQLKISKRFVPTISMKDTITAAKLDGTYRPAANNPISGGAYWITDLQKAAG